MMLQHKAPTAQTVDLKGWTGTIDNPNKTSSALAAPFFTMSIVAFKSYSWS